MFCRKCVLGGRRVWASLLCCAALAAAADGRPGPSSQPAPPIVDDRPDLQAVFDRAGVRGTFVLIDAGAGRMVLVNRQRAGQRFRPASTFKIANSLIALETGVVKDQFQIIPYGGKPQPVKAWEHDMDMQDAIRISNVAIYQEIARRIGLARMRDWVRRLDYGNAEIGNVVDEFWLDGPLEISAIEEARFVQRLAQGTLPMSQRSQSIVREILCVENNHGTALYAKTGWAARATPQIGWWTGWVERDGKVFAFSINIDVASEKDLPKRESIARELLSKLGA